MIFYKWKKCQTSEKKSTEFSPTLHLPVTKRFPIRLRPFELFTAMHIQSSDPLPYIRHYLLSYIHFSATPGYV